jgi:type II secretory pathway pseudopilin PulG
MRSAQQGFTYVVLIIAVAIIGVGLAAKGVEWDRSAQRAREAELLFVGNEFRRAIALYYYRSPGPVQEYPQSLEDLLEDRRYPGTQRYLRRIYRDPVTGKPEWGLVTIGGRIIGVHSLSTGQPIKSGNFSEANREFAERNSYSEWQFIFAPVVAAGTTQKGPR